MIKNLNKKTALQETPDTNNYWKNLSSEDRINLIRNKVDEKGFKFTRADERGFQIKCSRDAKRDERACSGHHQRAQIDDS